MEAKEGTIKHKMWSTVSKDDILSSDVTANGMKFSSKILSTKYVFIDTSQTCNFIRYIGMGIIMSDPRKLRGLMAIDPFETPNLRTLLFNNKINPLAKQKIHSKVAHIFEANLYAQNIEMASVLVLTLYNRLTGNDDSQSKDISNFPNYVSFNVLLPEPQIFTPNISYFRGITFICVSILGLAFITLMVEVLIKFKRK